MELSLRISAMAMITLCGVGVSVLAEREPVEQRVLNREGRNPQPIVAVENVIAWPNLQMLPNGEILAFLFNQPIHGRLPGDVECWASTDGGETWSKRSVAAPRGAPHENRQHKAVGLTADGNVILVSTGWSDPGNTNAWNNLGRVLPPWVCISKDNGRTWTIDREGFPAAPLGRVFHPFGDIQLGADGTLRVPTYLGRHRPESEGELPAVPENDPIAQRAAGRGNWIVVGSGDGRTWQERPVPISGNLRQDECPFNETDILHLGDGIWLAAARFRGSFVLPFRSEDDAQTWEPVDAQMEMWKEGSRRIPADLEQLADGTVIMSRGNRGSRPKSVEILFSEDQGLTWSHPYCLVESKREDFGYPSSVQRADGSVVTAYYEGFKQDGHTGPGDYRMCVVIWDPEQTRQQPSYVRTRVMTRIARAQRMSAEAGRLDEATGLLRTILERDDLQPDVRLETQRALAGLLAGHNKAAAIEAHRAILSLPGATDDDTALALYEVALLQYELELYDAFIETADRLIASGPGPNVFNALYKKAMVLEERGQVEQAIATFVDCAADKKTPPRQVSSAYYYAAEVSKRNNRLEQAREYYAKCLAVYGGHGRIQKQAREKVR